MDLYDVSVTRGGVYIQTMDLCVARDGVYIQTKDLCDVSVTRDAIYIRSQDAVFGELKDDGQSARRKLRLMPYFVRKF